MHARPKSLLMRVAQAALILVSASALTACTPPSQRKTDCSFDDQVRNAAPAYGSDVSVVMAPSSSFVDFGHVIDASTEMFSDAVGLAGARVSIVLADGSPSLVRTLPPQTGDTEDDTRIINRHMMSALNDVYFCAANTGEHPITTPLPVDAQVDLLGALGVAATAFDDGHDSGNRHILVMSNGLETAGQVDFSQRGIPGAADIGSVVGALKSQGALPNLHGAIVDFVGLGVVNASEPQLNQQTRDGLVAFWQSVVLASGGRVGRIVSAVVDGTPVAGSIAVRSVAGLADACIDESITEDDGVRFVPGSPEFLDVAAATAVAQSIAAKVSSSNCPGTLTVTGFVASGVPLESYVFGNPEDLQLSADRATAFAALLTANGVDVPISIVGGGKGPVTDWDDAGNFVEDLGKQNRAIVVTQ